MCNTNYLKRKFSVFVYWNENIYASIHDGGLETEGKAYEKLCNISLKQHLNLPQPRFCWFLKIPEELGKLPEISLIFHEKAIPLSFSEFVGTPKVVRETRCPESG